MEKFKIRYSARELSFFCRQIALLLGGAIPLDEGLYLMAEEANGEEEKRLLQWLGEEVELGTPFSQALEKAEVYPSYLVRMVRLGEETGTVDEIMESLGDYYRKEDLLAASIRNAVTYPVIMVFMLLVVLLVLFTRVMPVFENVYEQLGARMSPASTAAASMGAFFCQAALILGAVLILAVGAVWLAGKKGIRIAAAEKMKNKTKRKSLIAQASAKRRFTSVLALTLHCGLDLEKGMEMAGEMADNPLVEEKAKTCMERLETGEDTYTAIKDTGLFSGFYSQMIKTGIRSGSLDKVLEEISGQYEREAEERINRLIGRFEPTIVAVLSVAVGLILLSVMLPLVSVLSAIG